MVEGKRKKKEIEKRKNRRLGIPYFHSCWFYMWTNIPASMNLCNKMISFKIMFALESSIMKNAFFADLICASMYQESVKVFRNIVMDE